MTWSRVRPAEAYDPGQQKKAGTEFISTRPGHNCLVSKVGTCLAGPPPFLILEQGNYLVVAKTFFSPQESQFDQKGQTDYLATKFLN